ncbi:hypothetical protein QP246_11430, partial [Aerococcus urinae]|uniref:hypothetical protein n=1 Tax=Aerococcus urinae TaxID=1376 RepID=UPI00254F4A98
FRSRRPCPGVRASSVKDGRAGKLQRNWNARDWNSVAIRDDDSVNITGALAIAFHLATFVADGGTVTGLGNVL